MNDPIENEFKKLCRRFDIRYVGPGEAHYDRERCPDQRLDFYLPDFGIFVECKAHPTERLHGQLESAKQGTPIIVLITRESVIALFQMLSTAI